MFTWLNKQGVVSDEGFTVQFTGRFDAEYRENDRTVSLYVEGGVTDEGLACICIDPSAFERWDDGQVIDDADRLRMFENLRRAIEFQGMKLMVERGDF